MAKEYIKVAPGQIWKDCDVRMGERYVLVISLDMEHANCVRCDVNGTRHIDKTVRLMLRRMRPGSTGWMCVSECSTGKER